jgi:hypothetical protein
MMCTSLLRCMRLNETVDGEKCGCGGGRAGKGDENAGRFVEWGASELEASFLIEKIVEMVASKSLKEIL